jgi:ATP-dependent protease Clp ATPase subunit
MFDLPSEDNVKKIVINRESVERREQPLRLLDKKIAN